MKKMLLIVLTLVVMTVGCSKAQELSGKCPDCTLSDLNGKQAKISDVKDKPKVILFWTTWCPYCRISIKKLNTIFPEIEKSGVEIMAVNVGESKDKVEQFRAANNLTLPVFLDGDAACSHSYDVVGVPTYVFVGTDGTIKAVEHEFPPDYKKILMK